MICLIKFCGRLSVILLASSFVVSSHFQQPESHFRPSYCGLTRYDITNETIQKYNLDVGPDELQRFEQKHVPKIFRQDRNSPSVYSRASQGLLRQSVILTLFPIRLRVLYDISLVAEHPEPAKLERFIRNFLLATQMLFEQPELHKRVKVQLVVVELAQLEKEFVINESVTNMLTNVNQLNMKPNEPINHDLTLVLLNRAIFEASPLVSSPLQGIATLASFCNHLVSIPRGLFVHTAGLNRIKVLAHELAHNLGVIHDNLPETPCPDGPFIMSRFYNDTSINWSPCSVRMMESYILQKHVFECVYNQERLKSAIPINEQFNWLPSSGGRNPLPGEEVPPDEQCRLVLGGFSKALSKKLTRDESCKVLTCDLEEYLIRIGPALAGSECLTKSGTAGKCLAGRCLIPQADGRLTFPDDVA